MRDPALTLLRIDLDKLEYRRGQAVSARVRTLRTDHTGAPRVDVALELRRADSGESGAALRSLKVTTGSDGEAQVRLGDLEPGAYRVVRRGSMDGRPAEARATFVVQAEGHELLDVVAREEVLRELAARPAPGGCSAAKTPASTMLPRELVFPMRALYSDCGRSA